MSLTETITILLSYEFSDKKNIKPSKKQTRLSKVMLGV